MKKRLKEPSTWGGIGLLLMSLSQIFGIEGAAIVGESISKAANSGNIQLTIGAAVAALAAVLMKEKQD